MCVLSCCTPLGHPGGLSITIPLKWHVPLCVHIHSMHIHSTSLHWLLGNLSGWWMPQEHVLSSVSPDWMHVLVGWWVPQEHVLSSVQLCHFGLSLTQLLLHRAALCSRQLPA